MNVQGEAAVQSQPVERVVPVDIDRPEARNALNFKTREKLAAAVGTFASHPGIVITGRNGDFVAGSYTRAFEKLGFAGVLAQRPHRSGETIAGCPKPVIAPVESYAPGSGHAPPIHADIITATRTAMSGQPKIKLGLHCRAVAETAGRARASACGMK
ncbi:enoyl-CoA hydratase-related protein [Mesorhizobium sp. ASY16-5R]|jgi:enoyl-CoA hydratase|uniref:enoyl-CoA hydratase-related protein n=1 Tax=Mesorhizobium sp. ASY16-5R TaxID=3445772 RepID=UPI003FA00C84